MEQQIGALLDAVDLGAWYSANPWAFDSIVYFIFFIGLSRALLAERFGGRAGAAVSGALGAALAVGATVAARQAGWSLVGLGPVAWVLLLIVLASLVYGLLRRIGLSRVPSVALSLIVLSGIGSTLGAAVDVLLVAVGLGGGLAALGGIGLVTLIVWFLTKAGGRSGVRISTPQHTTENNDEQSDDMGVGRATDQINRSEAKIAQALERLHQHVKQHGLDNYALGIIDDLRVRRRDIDGLYAMVLRSLAKQGLRDGSLPRATLEAAQAVMLRARENTMHFRDTLEVAVAAHQEGNRKLFMEAVERLLKLERESIGLNEQLRELLRSNHKTSRRR